MKKIAYFLQSLKKMKPLDLVYPGALILFFGLIGILFFFMMQFISQSINRAFSSENSVDSQALNIEHYKLVAKKLNIPVNIPQDSTSIIVSPVVFSEAKIPTQSTSTPVAMVLDKKAITIMVRNSTEKRGEAGILAKTLENAGFQKAQTGNELKLYATTTILIKESKRDYESLLLEAVRVTYPNAIATTTGESSPFDAIVIIGNQ